MTDEQNEKVLQHLQKQSQNIDKIIQAQEGIMGLFEKLDVFFADYNAIHAKVESDSKYRRRAKVYFLLLAAFDIMIFSLIILFIILLIVVA